MNLFKQIFGRKNNTQSSATLERKRKQHITSLLANETVDKEGQRKQILAVLSDKPQTYRQIAKKLNWEADKVSKRIVEIVRLGYAKACEPITCPEGGRLSTTYVKA